MATGSEAPLDPIVLLACVTLEGVRSGVTNTCSGLPREARIPCPRSLVRTSFKVRGCVSQCVLWWGKLQEWPLHWQGIPTP